MKKILTIFLLILYIGKSIDAQCPPGAFAYQSVYPQCPTGCGVLLLGWPAGVLVNIYGGSPLIIVSNALISGTLGGGGTGDAFTCVPCNTPLVYASAVPGASTGCVIATIGIVPVKLTGFMVKIADKNNCEIKWTSTQETEPVKYIIQRSNDGRNYTDIASINGLRQAVNNYTYSDLATYNGTVFYRIKVVDLSGNILYSEVVNIKIDNSFGLSIFPNPTTKDFNFTIPTKFLPATYEIFDAKGRRLFTNKTIMQTTNINKLLSKGIYSLKVTGNNNISLTKKVMVH